MQTQNYINHIAFVIDASISMEHHESEVPEIADNLVQRLAARSKELDQETRVSIYTFADTVTCQIFDKDVLRLPSIKGLYRAYGNTALIDATLQARDDLAKTATMYGDHAFLIYVITDGEENRSKHTPTDLQRTIAQLPDNYTLAVFVPDQHGVFEAKKFGFAQGNIAIWSTTSVHGLENAREVMYEATDRYMVQRATGNFKGTRALFDMSSDTLNAHNVRATLTPLANDKYIILRNTATVIEIKPFVELAGVRYTIGMAYYQLTKTEHIQPRKKIAIRERSTGKVYTGADARALLGLPNAEIKVTPQFNQHYDVFVQSLSVNRKLMPNTDVLVIY